MTDKPVEYRPYSRFEEGHDDLPLDPYEVEVRLAIADYVIRRVAGTPTGESIFKGVVKHFENRYPHHKLLSLYLTSPESLVPEEGEFEPGSVPETDIYNPSLSNLNSKLRENLLHGHPGQEPSGPLAGLSFDLNAPRPHHRKK